MENEHIDALLEASRPRLSTNERARIWQKVAADIAAPAPVLSPYWNFVTTLPTVPYIIALMLVLGAGGTVAIAEAAKPGDILFPLEQATERARLALASEDGERVLRNQFAGERLAELRAILDEEASGSPDDLSVRSAVGMRTPITNLEISVDVFTDTTVVKVEENDVKTRFVMAAAAKDVIVAEIMHRYGFTESEVIAALTFNVEDRASRPRERGGVINSNLGEARVGIAVNALLDELDSLGDADTRGRLVAELLRELNDVAVASRGMGTGTPAFTSEARIKIEDDRIEVHEHGYRVRFESVDVDNDDRDDWSGAAQYDDSDLRDEADTGRTDDRDDRDRGDDSGSDDDHDDSNRGRGNDSR
jgi:hypothetical protein